MSKLYKLKKWLKLDEAAEHLSIIFGEEVTEADLLQFAVDGHLQMSIFLADGCQGRRGKFIPVDQAPYTEMLMPFGGTSRKYGGKLFGNLVLMFEEEITNLEGVYDLSMYGSERNDLERRYQASAGLPSSERTSFFHGAILKSGNDYWSVQLRDDDDPLIEGSSAQLDALLQVLSDDEIKQGRIAELEQAHKPKRDKFSEERLRRPYFERFRRARLPGGSVFVVRTPCLNKFVESLDTDKPDKTIPISTRERDTLLKLLIGMAIDGYDYEPSAAKSPVPKQLQDVLAALRIDVSDDTIRKYLKEAVRNVLPGPE